jgi:hypothetical protein
MSSHTQKAAENRIGSFILVLLGRSRDTPFLLGDGGPVVVGSPRGGSSIKAAHAFERGLDLK